MSYKRIEPEHLVVGKTYYIVPTARLITHNKKDVKFIREHLKTRFLFPEGKLETMRDVPEGKSYAESVYNRPGYEFMPASYFRWLPACSFTGLKSHGKPLVKPVKNFIYGPSKVQGYTFFSTELTPDPTPEPKMECPNCKKELALENGLLKLKIKTE
jgi:hypothetical protein